MEQHPVPQNVTTFQFRLIGDMTIKQFGFLAGGAILAYVCYKLPLPIFFTWPLTALFALGGIGFAFVPVEERPMDVWVLSFIKSVYSPTQYLWHKTAPPTASPGKKVSTTGMLNPQIKLASPVASEKQTTTLASPVNSTIQIQNTESKPSNSQPVKKSLSQIIAGIFTVQTTTRLPPQKINTAVHSPVEPEVLRQNQPIPQPQVAFTVPKVDHAQVVQTSQISSVSQANDGETKAAALQNRIDQLQTEVQEKTQTDVRILELQKQLTDTLGQKNKMEKELNFIRQRLQAQPSLQPTATRPAGFSAFNTRAPTVNVMAPDQTIKAGLPRLTTLPNVVTGIIKDGENNYLPAVLVTVRDQNDIPLRALKTNKLGQFAASTPLPSGTYLIEIEDPRERYSFDRAQITLNGSVMPALEIIAKSQKELTREKLQKEIFGNQQI